MKRFVKKISIMLAAVLLISNLSVGQVFAATVPHLNKTNLTLNVKKSYQLKLLGNNKKVRWSSSRKSVATVNSRGKVTAKKKGNTDITASVGSKKYTCKVTVTAPAKKVTSVKLNKRSYTLKKKGAAVTLKASVRPSSASNKSVTWTSSNKKVATVNASGKVTAVGNGKCTITATAKDGSKKKASCKITVKFAPVKVNKVSFHKSAVTLTKKGQTYTLKATVSPASANNKALTWTSSNKKVATVNSSGKITALRNGTATISATAKDGSRKKASCKVTVRIKSTPAPVIPVSVVTLDKTSLKLTKPGQGVNLSASVSPSNATDRAVFWDSSNDLVATVNASGYVTAVGNGSCVISAIARDGSGKKGSCKVTVAFSAEPEAPQTEPSRPVIHVNSVGVRSYIDFTQKGETFKLTAYVAPSDADNKEVRWSSSNTAVATVDQNGLVTAVGNGKAIVTLTSVDGGKTATCNVTVDIPAPPKPEPEPEKPPVGPSFPAVENVSLQGGESTICSFGHETGLNAVELKKIIYTVQGDINCINVLGDEYDPDVQRRQFTIKTHKAGNLKIIAKYNGNILKTWNITITSNWDVYMRYENWKNGVKREICPSGNATLETLDALRQYIVNNFSYSMDSPGASNKYYAWEYMKCDCFGAAGMFGDIASDLGFKVGYVNGAGTIYSYMSDAVSNPVGHVSNAVNINGEWKYYDATPY